MMFGKNVCLVDNIQSHQNVSDEADGKDLWRLVEFFSQCLLLAV